MTEALRAIRGPLFGLFLAAVDTGDNKAASTLSGRLHENLARTAKLTGELVPHAGTSITNILLSPDFQRLRAELIRVLVRYPQSNQVKGNESTPTRGAISSRSGRASEWPEYGQTPPFPAAMQDRQLSVESRCGAVAVGLEHICSRPFRLAVPHWFGHGSVSTSRSSNRTGGFTASGSRTRRHAFTHDGPRPSWDRRTSPKCS